MYKKLTNTELDLATNWQKFQQAKWGNILVEPAITPAPNESLIDKEETHYLIEAENLNDD